MTVWTIRVAHEQFRIDKILWQPFWSICGKWKPVFCVRFVFVYVCVFLRFQFENLSACNRSFMCNFWYWTAPSLILLYIFFCIRIYCTILLLYLQHKLQIIIIELIIELRFIFQFQHAIFEKWTMAAGFFFFRHFRIRCKYI